MKKYIPKRWWLRYQYFKRTGFYNEVGKGILNFLMVLALFFVLLFVAEKTFLDLNATFDFIVNNVSRNLILLIFFVSESLLSLIPSDLFIVWSKSTTSPWLFLTYLAILSCAAGIVSYSIGGLIRKNRKVNKYFSLKFEKHIKNSKKWGGWIIAIAALTPLPYSLIMVVMGMLRYDFRSMLLWNLLRIVRFYIYGLLLFPILNI